MPSSRALSVLIALAMPLLVVVAAPGEPIAAAAPKKPKAKPKPTPPPPVNCDVDGDGHNSIDCGGNDCDDGDASRHPSAAEICDAADKDEDCNPETIGMRDVDGDGEVDYRCANKQPNGVVKHGSDCDDNFKAIVPGAMRCDGERIMVCSAESGFQHENCPPRTVCWSQPNGTGVCAPQARPLRQSEQ